MSIDQPLVALARNSAPRGAKERHLNCSSNTQAPNQEAVDFDKAIAGQVAELIGRLILPASHSMLTPPTF